MAEDTTYNCDHCDREFDSPGAMGLHENWCGATDTFDYYCRKLIEEVDELEEDDFTIQSPRKEKYSETVQEFNKSAVKKLLEAVS